MNVKSILFAAIAAGATLPSINGGFVCGLSSMATAAVDPAAFANARTASGDTAVPVFKYGVMTFKKPATPEQIAEAKAKVKNKSSRISVC